MTSVIYRRTGLLIAEKESTYIHVQPLPLEKIAYFFVSNFEKLTNLECFATAMTATSPPPRLINTHTLKSHGS
jgi:hypothetical protein